jgi:hypothetical protein
MVGAPAIVAQAQRRQGAQGAVSGVSGKDVIEDAGRVLSSYFSAFRRETEALIVAGENGFRICLRMAEVEP